MNDIESTLRQYADEDNWVADEYGIKRVWMEPDSSTPTAYHGYGLAVRALSNQSSTAGAAKGGNTSQVGCERDDGLLNIHAESESCEVCTPIPPLTAPAPLTDEGDFAQRSRKELIEYIEYLRNALQAAENEVFATGRTITQAAPAPQQSELSRTNEIMRKALEDIAQPADAGCGCSFPCRCNSPEAEAINAEAMRDIASAALSEVAKAAPAAPVQTAEKMSEHARWTIKQAADALAYVAFNFDGSKLEDLRPGIVESTGAAETALIAERNLRDLLTSVAVQAEQAQAEPIGWLPKSALAELRRETTVKFESGVNAHIYRRNPHHAEVAGTFMHEATADECISIYAVPVAALPAQAEQAAAVRAAYEKAARYVDDLQADDQILTFNVIADGIRGLAKEVAVEAPSQQGESK